VTTGEHELAALLASMNPVVVPGEFVFVTVGATPPDLEPRATVVEDEGVSLVITREQADERGWEYDFVAAWITLRVHSALDAVGLTAAVSTVLTQEEISCNVIAGRLHDHLLVPWNRSADALQALESLRAGGHA
jgi:uncharacterized protein